MTGYRARNRALINEKQKIYAKTPRAKAKRRDLYSRRRLAMLLKEARRRARKKGLEFSLVEADLVIPAVCPVLGIPIVPGGPNQANWPSLDRFNNSLGYVPGNVDVISHRANCLKRDASVEEVEKLLAYLRDRR